MKKLYLIPDPRDLEESVSLAERYDAAFEYNDFFIPRVLDDRELLFKTIDMYKALPRERKNDTMHGAFLDVTVHSEDPLIREISEKRVLQSMEAAKELSLRGVVFHTGAIPNFNSGAYEKRWLSANISFWSSVCERYPDTRIYMENMFDIEPDLLLALAEETKDIPNFGICLDYAHAKVFGGDPYKWLKLLAPYVLHMHINDNDGKSDLHLAVGDGIIDWNEFSKGIADLDIKPSVLIETSAIDRQKRSLEFMSANKIYPF